MTTYSTDFLAFGVGAGANVVSQATYAAASYVSTGFQSGTAQSAAVNKALRQSSFVAAGLSQWLATAQGANVSDDGNLSNFVTLLTAALPSTKTAQSWTGAQTFTSPLNLTGAAGTNRQIFLQTAGSNRFSVYLDNSAESGGNAGSTFEIGRYSDAGAYIDSPLVISRASGLVTLNDGLAVTGGITGALTGNVTGNCSGSSGSCTGNAATATKLATVRTLTFTGSATGSGSFDGSANVSITLSPPNSTANTLRGNNTGSAAAPTDLTIPQAQAMLFGQYAQFQYQQPSGTSPSESLAVSQWTQRQLNTSVSNNIAGASLSANQITLPAGTYMCFGQSPSGTSSNTGATRTRVRDVTHSTTLITGGSNSSGNGIIYNTLGFSGFFTLSGTTTIEVDTYSTANMNTPGAMSTGDPEVGTVINFLKIG